MRATSVNVVMFGRACRTGWSSRRRARPGLRRPRALREDLVGLREGPAQRGGRAGAGAVRISSRRESLIRRRPSVSSRPSRSSGPGFVRRVIAHTPITLRPLRPGRRDVGPSRSLVEPDLRQVRIVFDGMNAPVSHDLLGFDSMVGSQLSTVHLIAPRRKTTDSGGRQEALRVGVLGAGTWARVAHVPGWQRDPGRTSRSSATSRGIARATSPPPRDPQAADDWQVVVARPDLDVIDIVTPSRTHFELAWAALEAGKHVLCEKPVAYDYRQTRRAAELARKNGLKTKLGFTFRYSPGVQFAKSLLDEGFAGTPLHLQRVRAELAVARSPGSPPAGRPHERPGRPPDRVPEATAPIIDVGHWWVGMARGRRHDGNFVPERVVRATGRMMRMNIDDGDIFIGEYTNGALGSIQTSFVTVGNYPGIEARLYGSQGAVICRLVEERGVAETINVATPDDVEFRELPIPPRFYPAGGHSRESSGPSSTPT